MIGYFCALNGNHRQVQTSANRARDVLGHDALLGYSVTAGARSAFLDRQPKKLSRIESMHGGPSITAITDIRGRLLLARNSNQSGD